jgi:hypothetical protein
MRRSIIHVAEHHSCGGASFMWRSIIHVTEHHVAEHHVAEHHVQSIMWQSSNNKESKIAEQQ